MGPRGGVPLSTGRATTAIINRVGTSSPLAHGEARRASTALNSACFSGFNSSQVDKATPDLLASTCAAIFFALSERPPHALRLCCASTPSHLTQRQARVRAAWLHVPARPSLPENTAMNTEVQLGAKGLDAKGESILTIAELLRHMENATIVALLDSAISGVTADAALLEVRRSGTFLVLPHRATSLEHSMTSTVALINALARVATEPGEEAASELRLAEMELDETSLKCLRSAIYEVCRAEERAFQVAVGTKSMKIQLPHRSVVSNPQIKPDPAPSEDKDKIQQIRPYLDAICATGMATLIKTRNAMPAVKKGDRVLVRMATRPKRFLQLNDDETDQVE